MKINILGAGNVATHLVKAFVNSGNEVSVWNRSSAHLTRISEDSMCYYCTDNISLLPKDVDLYIISVKDDAVANVANMLSKTILNKEIPVVHTSGSLPLGILTPFFENPGVLYPLQTFTKDKQIDYKSITFFIEGTNFSLKLLQQLLKHVSTNIYILDSNERKILHLASVFACNFINHDIAIASKLLSKIEIPLSVLFPIISETIKKIESLSPIEAQTGPAVREDFNIIDEHVRLLSDFPSEKKIYVDTTNNIIRYKHLK